MSTRDQAVLWLNGRKGNGAVAGGGNVLLTTPRHKLDGPEHQTADDTTTLDATTTQHGLMPKLSGDAADVFRGDGSQAPIDADEITYDNGTSGLSATAVQAAIDEIAAGGGGGGSGTLTTIEEVDGSPTDSAVTKLVFPNGTLSIVAHVATYTPAGGGGSSDAILGKSGRGGSRISGLDGSPDVDVAGTNDDEFNDSALTGWTTFGSPTTADADTSRKGHLYLRKAAASGAHVAGIYKANPSMPFTMTAKMSAFRMGGDFNMAGLFVGVTNPASGAFKAVLYQEGAPSAGLVSPGVIAWSNPTTYNGAGTYWRNSPHSPIYLRIIATSSSNVTFQASLDGTFFHTIVSANNPGFTIGSVGLFVNPDSASNDGEAAFDWIRFT